jgi:hypothetical protein
MFSISSFILKILRTYNIILPQPKAIKHTQVQRQAVCSAGGIVLLLHPKKKISSTHKCSGQ